MIIEIKGKGDVVIVSRSEERQLDFGVKYIIKDNNIIFDNTSEGLVVTRLRGNILIYKKIIKGNGVFIIGEENITSYKNQEVKNKPFKSLESRFKNIANVNEVSDGYAFRVVLHVWSEDGEFKRGYDININPRLYRANMNEDVIKLITEAEKLNLIKLYYHQGVSSYKINKRSLEDMKLIHSLTDQMIG